MERLLYLSEGDVNSIINDDKQLIIDSIEKAFKIIDSGRYQQPSKISQVFDEISQNRINCMPSTLLDEKVCGVKWVSVFPTNKDKKMVNVEGFTILSELITGRVISFMNSTRLTSLRTAGVGAVAAKYLAKNNSQSIGFIGAGVEARTHFEMIKLIRPGINKCYISSRTTTGILEFIDRFKDQYPDTEFINCEQDYEKAVKDADIVVTAISSQDPVLKADWINKGVLYIHVAGLEDEFNVALKADKIVCDLWENVKHRAQTIAQMYKKGLLKDSDIYSDLAKIIIGEVPGRQTDDEFIYFNSVGLSVIDVLLSNIVYNLAIEKNIGTFISK